MWLLSNTNQQTGALPLMDSGAFQQLPGERPHYMNNVEVGFKNNMEAQHMNNVEAKNLSFSQA